MMLVIGGLNALTQMLFITAVTRSEVANVVVIVAAAPLFAALIAWVALRERTEPRVAAAIALTTLGIGSVMAGSLGTPTLDGDLIAVLAILAFAATIVIWRRHPGLDRPRTLVVGSVIMAAAASLFADWSAIDARRPRWSGDGSHLQPDRSNALFLGTAVRAGFGGGGVRPRRDGRGDGVGVGRLR